MKLLFSLIIALICYVSIPIASSADSNHIIYDSARADSHAPTGVMRDHVHKKGEWMISYRYMYMDMDQNYKNDNKISEDEVHADFMVSPTNMKMYMHMLGIMYAPEDWVTLAIMVPYVQKHMDHVNRMGRTFDTKSEGFGDLKTSALIPVWEHKNHKAHIMAGVSWPTGSIDKRDDTLVGPNQKLPYPMQIGSGTYDLLPGITYIGQYENLSWGTQVNGVIRLGENDNDYTLGNRMHLTGWLAYAVKKSISTSFRINWQNWQDVDGADPDISQTIAPMGATDLTGGNRLDLGFGINIYRREGFLNGHRLTGEFILPVYQNLDGPQLGTSYQFILGWQYSF